jgi:hypothetical protein
VGFVCPTCDKNRPGGLKQEHLEVEDANAHSDQRGSSEVCGVLTLAYLMLVRDVGIKKALDGPLERVVSLR